MSKDVTCVHCIGSNCVSNHKPRFLLKELNDSDGLKLLNKTKTLLLTSPFNQHLYWKDNYAKKTKRIEQICKRFQDINLIYSALQEIHILFRQNDFRLQKFFLNG